MQQTPTFEAVGGNVLIIPIQYRETAKYGIAVMPAVIHRVLAVGVVKPSLVRKKLMLRMRGMLDTTCMSALHLLQEHNVGIEFAQSLAQFMQHEPAVELREPFMDIVGGNGYFTHAGRGGQVFS